MLKWAVYYSTLHFGFCDKVAATLREKKTAGTLVLVLDSMLMLLRTSGRPTIACIPTSPKNCRPSSLPTSRWTLKKLALRDTGILGIVVSTLAWAGDAVLYDSRHSRIGHTPLEIPDIYLFVK